MKRTYRINKDAKPYPGKVFHTEGTPDEKGYIWGYVRIDFRRTSGLKEYHESKLTEQGQPA